MPRSPLIASLFALCALVIAVATAPAHAQSANCAPRDQIIEHLKNNYGEHPIMMGLTPQNTVMEVFTSNETGTWTITVTLPNGTTCLVASGQNIQAIEAAAKGTPA